MAYTQLSRKVKKYADEAFNHQNTIDAWNDTMLETIQSFNKRKSWSIEEI